MPEIERKFFFVEMPPVDEISEIGVEIIQGYLFTEDGEVRVRQKGISFFLTVKGEGDLSRNEWESPIPEWVFKTLWPKTEGRRIEKTRYSIYYQGLTLEVDEYYGRLEGLFTLECEFPIEEAAYEFILPAWAVSAVDVTDDPAYKNKNLAVHGLPKEKR